MYSTILRNPALPVSRRLVRLIRYLHLRTLGWLTLKQRYKKARSEGFKNHSMLDRRELTEYKKYWRAFGHPVETQTVTKCSTISGRYSRNIMPEDVFSADVERSLNAISDSSFLQNKNIYHRWFTAGKFPRSYFHKIYGCFYDDQFNRIRSIDQFLTNSEIPPQGVLKVSHDSSGGIGVYFISSIKELAEQLDGPMNLVFQERIIQDESLDRIYRKSLNTVRACLYRSVRDDSIHVLNMSLRMGKGGSLDNETAGGIVCSINDGGSLNEFSVDKHGIKYFEHPDTQFIFKGASVPDYEAARSVAIDVFAQMPHSRLASLDLCYDESGSWRVIEINLVDQTIRFAQYAGKPFFGEFTDEVKEWVQKNHWALKR